MSSPTLLHKPQGTLDIISNRLGRLFWETMMLQVLDIKTCQRPNAYPVNLSVCLFWQHQILAKKAQMLTFLISCAIKRTAQKTGQTLTQLSYFGKGMR
jgi:hypothetical protein